MSSKPSGCPWCKTQGRYGFDGGWCHDDLSAALFCPREGWTIELQIELEALRDPATEQEQAEAMAALDALRVKLQGTS